MERIAFRKMQGLGNDFIVLDARAHPLGLSEPAIRRITDRRFGIGCDQLLILEKPQNGGDVFMRIYNPDGSQAGACGNGTRCVARLILDETGRPQISIETVAGLLVSNAVGRQVRVDMGKAATEWNEIPLVEARDTNGFTLEGAEAFGPASAVNMGNPHVVFFVPEVASLDLASIGPPIERHPLFPERANVSFAKIEAPGEIRLRVWERGAGQTLACGTGACATLVSAARRGLCGRQGRVHLPGGTLEIEWRADGHVLMTGPAETSFEGIYEAAA